MLSILLYALFWYTETNETRERNTKRFQVPFCFAHISRHSWWQIVHFFTTVVPSILRLNSWRSYMFTLLVFIIIIIIIIINEFSRLNLSLEADWVSLMFVLVSPSTR